MEVTGGRFIIITCIYTPPLKLSLEAEQVYEASISERKTVPETLLRPMTSDADRATELVRPFGWLMGRTSEAGELSPTERIFINNVYAVRCMLYVHATTT